MAFLTRTDPLRNLYRFYVVRIAPTLFGEWSLVREWGRVGSPGTMRATIFKQQHEAQRAEQRSIKRRLAHGYTERETGQSA